MLILDRSIKVDDFIGKKNPNFVVLKTFVCRHLFVTERLKHR
jgi:hypothetical protein